MQNAHAREHGGEHLDVVADEVPRRGAHAVTAS
jgi:hypothetical protein